MTWKDKSVTSVRIRTKSLRSLLCNTLDKDKNPSFLTPEKTGHSWIEVAITQGERKLWIKIQPENGWSPLGYFALDTLWLKYGITTLMYYATHNMTSFSFSKNPIILMNDVESYLNYFFFIFHFSFY